MSRKELEDQMGSLREKHQQDAASLKSQLSEAESQAKDVQKEVTWNCFEWIQCLWFSFYFNIKQVKSTNFLVIKLFLLLIASTFVLANNM